MNLDYMASGALTLLGFGLCFWIGMARLGHSAGDIVWALLAVQLASGIALPTVLYCQRSPKLRLLTKGPFRSWLMLLTLSIVVLVGVCPWLRDPVSLAWMFLPLFLAIGLMLKIYGPIQDKVLRKAALRKRG